MLVSRKLLLVMLLAVVGTLGAAVRWATAQQSEPAPVAEAPTKPEQPSKSRTDDPFGESRGYNHDRARRLREVLNGLDKNQDGIVEYDEVNERERRIANRFVVGGFQPGVRLQIEGKLTQARGEAEYGNPDGKRIENSEAVTDDVKIQYANDTDLQNADHAFNVLGWRLAPRSPDDAELLKLHKEPLGVRIAAGPKDLINAYLVRINENPTPDMSAVVEAIEQPRDATSPFDCTVMWLFKHQETGTKFAVYESRTIEPNHSEPVDSNAAETPQLQNGGFQFPTVEEQRYADRAFHLLAIEVQKLSREEFKRVAGLGLKGGVRIASPAGPNDATRASWLREGDILVGLKTSPITGLKDLFDFLGRDDLGESQPMKMYVVRGTSNELDGGFGGRERPPAKDGVISGRISPDMNAWQATQPQPEPEARAQPNADVADPAVPPGSPITLYDGKTFDEWRSMWKQELKPERRIEAVQALAAFAGNGYAEKATEAILDVASEIGIKRGDSLVTPVGKLRAAICDALAAGIDAEIAWPAVLARYKSDPDEYDVLVVAMLERIRPVANFREDLLELSKSQNADIWKGAFIRLLQTYPDDPEVQGALRKELQSDAPSRLSSAFESLVANSKRWIPAAEPALTTGKAEVQLAARRLASTIDNVKGRETAQRLVAALSEAEEVDEKIALIRAIAALNAVAPDNARAVIQQFTKDRDDGVAIAAVVAEVAVSNPKIYAHPSNFHLPREWAKERGVEQMTNEHDWKNLEAAMRKEVTATFGIE